MDLYYLKKGTVPPFISHKKADEIMNQIHECILEDKVNQRRIYRNAKPEIIETNLQFLELSTTDKKTNHLVETLIQFNMDCETLDPEYVLEAYKTPDCSSLIRMTPEGYIHTILVFFYNTLHDTIEVKVLCCDVKTRGGGTVFNYLINAVKCAIPMCKVPSMYKNEIRLDALTPAIHFYKKFGFQEEAPLHRGLQPLTRKLSEETEVSHENWEKVFHDVDLVYDIDAVESSSSNMSDVSVQANLKNGIDRNKYRLREHPRRKQFAEYVQYPITPEFKSNSGESDYEPSPPPRDDNVVYKKTKAKGKSKTKAKAKKTTARPVAKKTTAKKTTAQKKLPLSKNIFKFQP